MGDNGAGHVFVVGADLTRLSCDDVLVPTEEVAGLLRRLGYGSSSLSGKEPPPDEPTEPRDERVQEQLPG